MRIENIQISYERRRPLMVLTDCFNAMKGMGISLKDLVFLNHYFWPIIINFGKWCPFKTLNNCLTNNTVLRCLHFVSSCSILCSLCIKGMRGIFFPLFNWKCWSKSGGKKSELWLFFPSVTLTSCYPQPLLKEHNERGFNSWFHRQLHPERSLSLLWTLMNHQLKA